MSGGHWDYVQYRIQGALEDIGREDFVKERFPKLGEVIFKLGGALGDIIHDLDWDISITRSSSAC